MYFFLSFTEEISTFQNFFAEIKNHRNWSLVRKQELNVKFSNGLAIPSNTFQMYFNLRSVQLHQVVCYWSKWRVHSNILSSFVNIYVTIDNILSCFVNIYVTVGFFSIMTDVCQLGTEISTWSWVHQVAGIIDEVHLTLTLRDFIRKVIKLKRKTVSFLTHALNVHTYNSHPQDLL